MKRQSSLIPLDGAFGEGGGALVRTALVLSAITQQGFSITDVRGATRFPGLDVEDLSIIRALQSISGAEVSEIYPGCDRFSFEPTHSIKGLTGPVGIESAESKRHPNCLVLLNSLHAVLVHAGVYSSLEATGETFGSNTLSYDGFSESTLEALKMFGCYASPTLHEAAFGRESSGRVGFDIEPSYIEGFDWTDRGNLEEVTAYVSYAQLSEAIPQRAASHLVTLSRQAKLQTHIELQRVSAATPGIHVTVCARFERGFGSGSMTGTRGVRVEAIATHAFERMFEFLQSKASVDSYLADQILPFAAFAKGSVAFSVSGVSQRLLTAVWVMKQFMPLRISVTGEEGAIGAVRIAKG